MDLGLYLQQAVHRAFAWGVNDCCTFPADWVRGLIGTDPMARWRGRYTRETEARALIEEAGGLGNLWAEGLDSLCAPVHGSYEAGDVGVCLVIGEGGALVENGGIFTGRRWAFLAPRGLFISSMGADEIARAWRP